MAITRLEAKIAVRTLLREWLKEAVVMNPAEAIAIPDKRRGIYAVAIGSEESETPGYFEPGTKMLDVVISCYGTDEEKADILADELATVMDTVWPSWFIFTKPESTGTYDDATRTYVVRVSTSLVYV